MATTVGQHPVSNFTSPVNGDPLNADVVRSNDNTVRSAYVDHDADPGIHVQSSTLALRPAAGTAGRKWMTVDGTVVRYWYDTGSVWVEGTAAGLSSAQTIALTGDVTGSVSTDLSTGASIATAIGAGVIVNADINATAAIADTKLATISTAGKVSNSATTATNANTASTIVTRDASGNFSAGTITAALTGNASTASALQTARNINGTSFNGTADITVPAAAGTLTGATLASGVTASSLTSVGTITTGTWSASTIAVARGGTGATTIPTNGQLLIGNGTGYTVASLTAGSNVTITPGAGSITIASASSGGDVVGPASATDNALVRFDLTTGKLVQNSGTTLSDTGTLAMAGLLDISSASAGQIKFPATQVASSDVNTLDDYEEGPFTPTGSGITFTSASGTYTKIGRAVTFRLDALWPTTANASNARIAGLPFAPAVGTAFAVWSDKGTQVQALSSGSSIFLYDVSGVEYTNANMSTKAVSVSGVYFV